MKDPATRSAMPWSAAASSLRTAIFIATSCSSMPPRSLIACGHTSRQVPVTLQKLTIVSSLSTPAPLYNQLAPSAAAIRLTNRVQGKRAQQAPLWTCGTNTCSPLTSPLTTLPKLPAPRSHSVPSGRMQTLRVKGRTHQRGGSFRPLSRDANMAVVSQFQVVQGAAYWG